MVSKLRKKTQEKKQKKEAPIKKKAGKKKKVSEADEIRDTVKSPNKTKLYTPIDTTNVISTGSTLLDLCISGGRVRGGGLPTGIMVEIFGPSGAGKTAIVTELLAAVQYRGGDTYIDDPEGRFDAEYAKLFGYNMPKENYEISNKVKDVFNQLLKWTPADKKKASLYAVDSIAALCSDTESEDWDARGQAKAKELTQGCRKLSTKLVGTNRIVLFTNHEKDGEYGKTTPGGKAVPYHSSLRIRIHSKKPIEKKKKYKSTVNGETHEKDVTQSIGIQSICEIKKSSIDKEFRAAPLFIVNGIGIDDIRANLQYIKDMTKDTLYDAVGKPYQRMDQAVAWVEKNNLEAELRENVINIWEEIEEMFKDERKKKVRF